MRVNVTKSFLPPLEEYNEYLKGVWERSYLTNQGPLLKELENKLGDFLNVRNFHFLTNGTLALQLALKALDITEGEVITTPFSYVATTSSILWERCTPVFVDIEPNNFTVDANKIEEAITTNTKAILAVHVFGYACNVEKIEEIASKYNLRVIYDGAHAFASKYKGKSLLDYGDVSMCSFHATKLFHTIEGGACIVKDDEVNRKLDLLKRFGHEGDNQICLGINGKASEFQAAMGLANFKYIKEIIESRKESVKFYDELLDGKIIRPKQQKDLDYNYAYYPVLFKSEEELLRIFSALNKQDIYPRRYFYPSLNRLPYLKEQTKCPISENISSRIACLPLYHGIGKELIERIARVISEYI